VRADNQLMVRSIIEEYDPMAFKKCTARVFQIGGPEMTDPRDCCVYLVDVGVPVMIDTGAGLSYHTIRDAVVEAGFSSPAVDTIILTHCHMDHIGSAYQFQKEYGTRIVAHADDADAIEQGDPDLTASRWYGMEAPPTRVDLRLTGDQTLEFPNGQLLCLHTPGHTPGSIAVLFNTGNERVLFGQDVHGPFSPAFRSDVAQWASSMRRLMKYEADILCEGHFGIFRPAVQVKRYIESYLEHYDV
jgi:glyoxylase-like metal-dependent hydrolase (beta-lactamase superfamily II)